MNAGPPRRARLPDRMVLGSYVPSQESGCPSLDVVAPGPKVVQGNYQSLESLPQVGVFNREHAQSLPYSSLYTSGGSYRGVFHPFPRLFGQEVIPVSG